MRRHGIGYQRKVLALIRAGVISIAPGSLNIARIDHHPDCGFLKDPCRVCSCDPDIIVTTHDPEAA